MLFNKGPKTSSEQIIYIYVMQHNNMQSDKLQKITSVKFNVLHVVSTNITISYYVTILQ